MTPGAELDARVHRAIGSPHEEVLPYSIDIAAAWSAVQRFFDGGEAITLSQDIDGRWIAHLSHWTNGGEYGPRIWDFTGWRQSYKGLTAPHAISLVIAGFFDGEGLDEWEYDVMTDEIDFYDDSPDGG